MKGHPIIRRATQSYIALGGNTCAELLLTQILHFQQVLRVGLSDQRAPGCESPYGYVSFWCKFVCSEQVLCLSLTINRS